MHAMEIFNPLASQSMWTWRCFRVRVGFGVALFALPTSLLLFLCWLRSPSRRRASHQPLRLAGNRISVEVSIPSGLVGYVIGRGGQTMRTLEEESGARIRLKDGPSGEGGGEGEERVAVVFGRPECVGRAEEALRALLEARRGRALERRSVLVPGAAVGRIIGRQGSNIRDIQRESGARVLVEGGRGRERVCSVTGTAQQISLALGLIQAAVQGREGGRRGHGTIRSPVFPEEDDFFPAYVSAVDRQGHVWVQPLMGGGGGALDELIDNMSDAYQGEGEGEGGLEVCQGMLVAAPFAGDESWYRARVEGPVEQGRVEVLYVDFGDRVSVRCEELKPLREDFLLLPAQAVCCQLSGVLPKGGEWSEEAVSALARVTLCSSWRVVMVKRVPGPTHTPHIRVVDTNTDQDVDAAQAFVCCGSGEWAVDLLQEQGLTHATCKHESDSPEHLHANCTLQQCENSQVPTPTPMSD